MFGKKKKSKAICGDLSPGSIFRRHAPLFPLRYADLDIKLLMIASFLRPFSRRRRPDRRVRKINLAG